MGREDVWNTITEIQVNSYEGDQRRLANELLKNKVDDPQFLECVIDPYMVDPKYRDEKKEALRKKKVCAGVLHFLVTNMNGDAEMSRESLLSNLEVSPEDLNDALKRLREKRILEEDLSFAKSRARIFEKRKDTFSIEDELRVISL